MVSSPESGSWIERIRLVKERIISGIGYLATVAWGSLVEEAYDPKLPPQLSEEEQIQELRRNLNDDTAVIEWLNRKPN